MMQASFDPAFASHALASFEDDLREVFGRVAWDEAVVGGPGPV